MTLAWYIKRLSNMEPAEVLHRLREKIRKVQSQYWDQGWHRYPACKLHGVFQGLPEAVVNSTLAQRRAIASAAQETLDGRFEALGRTWPPRSPHSLFPVDLWRRDPVTGHSWPGLETYAFKVGFRHSNLGDIKYVWEINRLQFLPPLASHYLLERDKQCLVAIEDAIDSWHRANPPFSGVAWLSGIEVALRAISLILTFDLVGQWLGEKTHRQAGEILSASRYWLPRFPSRFSSANNHLIAELAGEYLLGLSQGSTPATARKSLIEEIQRQILEDGTGAEQTPTYAAFSAELALLSALAARQSGNSFPPEFDARLGAFADFIGWLGPNFVGFGDDDEGRVITLNHEVDYTLSVASAIQAYLQRPGIVAEAGDFRALIFGKPVASSPRNEGLRTFRQGGLSIWHGDLNGRCVELTFDHGPLGYLSIAAHGHADALSLTLAIDGMPVLTDPGTFAYGAGGIWRDWFRSTPAHNTLNIDGVSQSLIAGPFNWSQKAVASLVSRIDQPDWQLIAEHDGYRRRFNVNHRRELQKQPEGIVIQDRLLGGRQVADIIFQLADGITTQRSGDMVTLERNGELLMQIQFPSHNIKIARGGEVPGQGGWVSPRFGMKVPADRIVWSGVVDEPGVTTRLLL